MEMTLELVQQLAKVLTTHKLDRLELGELVLVKTKHEAARAESLPNNITASNQDIEDILFHSTSAPELTLEQLSSLTVTPLKRPRTKTKANE